MCNSLKTSIGISAVVLASCLAAPGAAAAEQAVVVDIPPQSLKSGLDSFARQTRQQLLYRPNLLEGKRSGAVRGTFTPEQALTRLLAGTWLTWERSGSGVFMIREAAKAHLQSTAAPAPLQTGQAKPVPVEQPAETAASDEIIVTAQRRSESITNVPLSITALSGEKLREAGVTDTIQLASLTPGLQMDRVGNNTLPAIRGVTTQITAPGSNSNVALYVDGIYQPSTIGNAFDLPDVERIEVLKGPQGTLFGRNATGGAIQIITRDPSYTPTGEFTASYGNYNEMVVRGFASVPIVDGKAAISLAGYLRDMDGYNTNLRTGGIVGDLNQKFIRGKIRLDPTDALHIVIGGYYSKDRNSQLSYGVALNGNTIARFDPQAIIPTQPWQAATDRPTIAAMESYGINGRVELETGAGKITSLTGYVHYKGQGDLDGDFGYVPSGGGVFYSATSPESSFSQEVNFASAWTGPFNFVVGAYYTKGEGSYFPLNITAPGLAIAIYGTQKTEAAAGYGEIYISPLPKLFIIGGLRYSWERRSLNSGVTGIGLAAPTLNPIGTKSWNSVTPRFSARYEFSPRSNVYFTYSQGFKSGVFATAALRINADGTLPAVDPETIKAYELGLKAHLNAAISVNAALFWYDYKNLQSNAFTNVNGVPLSIYQNAASARIKGAEFELNADLADYFQLHAGVSLLDAKFVDFRNAAVAVPRQTNGVVTNTGNVSVPFDASGKGLIRAPDFTVSVTPTFKAVIANGDFRLSGTLYYSGRIYYTFDNRISQSPYATVDARASWAPRNSGLTFAVYGRNLTNNAHIVQNFVTELADGVSYSQPRTYGIEVGYRF